MLSDSEAFSGVAVSDPAAAKAFYTDVLGLRVTEENGLLTLHLGGGTTVLVYPKPDFTPASFTVLNFPVADIDAAVDDLIARGVTFQRYPGLEADDKGVMRAPAGQGPQIAWFTDPAGNIFSVLQT